MSPTAYVTVHSVHSNTLHDAKNMHLLVSTLDITSWSSTLVAKFPVWVINLPATLWPSQQISIMYWLKWWFFKFQSSVSLTYVDLYDNSSNSSHMLSRYSLTYMAILRILVTFSSSFYSSLDNKAQLSAVLSLSQQSSCVSLSPKYTGKRNFMCFRNLPSGCSCS